MSIGAACIYVYSKYLTLLHHYILFVTQLQYTRCLALKKLVPLLLQY